MNKNTMQFSIASDKEAQTKQILTTVYDALKEKGYIFKDRTEECVDRYGNTAPYKRYWIVGNVYGDK